jgi:hypothetical protein
MLFPACSTVAMISFWQVYLGNVVGGLTLTWMPQRSPNPAYLTRQCSISRHYISEKTNSSLYFRSYRLIEEKFIRNTRNISSFCGLQWRRA